MPDVSIVDSVSLAEYVEILPDRRVSVYDAASVQDSGSLYVPIVLTTDPRDEFKMKTPVVKGKASFGGMFVTGQCYLPCAEVDGVLGMHLNKTQPFPTFSGSIADPEEPMLVAGAVATWAGAGRFGGRVVERRLPAWTGQASFDLSGIFRLSAKLPVWSLEAVFKYPDAFTLARAVPTWYGTGSADLFEIAFSLDKKIPGAFICLGSMHEDGVFTLSANVPVWVLESTIYQDSMGGSGVIPMPPPNLPSRASEVNRFTDYILRYVRL